MQTPHTLTGSERTDEALLLSVRGGDIKSFGELYERYYGRARSIAFRHTSDAARVDDIVSEAFARILQALKNGKGPHSYMGGYLATTIAHLAGEYGILAAQEIPSEQEHLESMGTLDETVMKLHESDEVISAFTSLPERWQTVLWMTEIEAKKPREVASALNLSSNAVSALAIRARESLKEGYLRAHQNSPKTPECNRFSTHISAYVRGSLSQKRSDALRSHMSDCPHCTAEYLYLVGINKSMRSWVFPVLAGLSLWTTDGAAVFSTAAITAAGAGSGAAALSSTGAVSSSASSATSFSVLSPKTWGSGAQLAAGAAAVTAASIAVASGAMLMGSDQGNNAAEASSDGGSMSVPGSSGSGRQPGSQPTPLGAEFSESSRAEIARASGSEVQDSSDRPPRVPADDPQAQAGTGSSGVFNSAATGSAMASAPRNDSTTGLLGTDTDYGSGGAAADEAENPGAGAVAEEQNTGDNSVAPAPAEPNPHPGIPGSGGAGTSPGTSGGPTDRSTADSSAGSGQASPSGTGGTDTGTAHPSGKNTDTDKGANNTASPTGSPSETPSDQPTDTDNTTVPSWYGSEEYRQWFYSIPWTAFDDSSLSTNKRCIISYLDSNNEAGYKITYLPQQVLNSTYTNYTLAAYFGWSQTVSVFCL